MEAKWNNILEQLHDITECCICSETLREPRVLPCIHTFCLDCLKKTHGSAAQPGNTMLCPICRSEFVIPSGGMHDLQKNFFMDRLIEMTKTTKPGKEMKKDCTLCGICAEDSGDSSGAAIPPATVHCGQCQQNLCDDCCRHHKKNKLTKTHRTVALEEQPEEPHESEHCSKSGVCDKHPGKAIEIYCSTCACVACLKCYFEAHQSHQCSEVGIVVADFQKQIVTDIHKVFSWASEARETLKQLENRKKEFLSNIDSLGTAVVCRGEELKRLIEVQAKALLSQLDTLKHKTIKDIENNKDSLERHIAILESYVLYCNAMSTSGTSSDICSGANELHARADKLLQLHESFEMRHPGVEKVSLMTDEPDELLKSCRNVVGKLNLSYESKQENKSRFYAPEDYDPKPKTTSKNTNSGELLSTEPIWRLETGNKQSVWEVAYLNNFIYVLKKENKQLLTFEDQVPFKLSGEISITQVKVPRDLAACQTHNCLYVVDDGRECVWKIPYPHFEAVRWLTGNGSPFKISVNKSGRVLIPREAKPCVIEVMKSDATLENSIVLPHEIKDLEYAIQSPSGTFIASYGKNASRNRGILEVSMEGHVLRTHSLPTEVWPAMRDPRYMTFGRGDDLFVTDFRNDRVIDFDSQLRMMQIVLNKLKHSISMPYRVCYIEDKEYLIVVHSLGYKVDIYRCSCKSYRVAALFKWDHGLLAT